MTTYIFITFATIYLVFIVDEVDGKEELNLVEDDREFLAVKKEYKKLLY